MSHHTIERELLVDARPATVYEVITDPRHMTQWWPDHARLQPVGQEGAITFGDPDDPAATVVPLTVVAAEPPRHFSFRWAYPAGETPTATNSYLVTFDLDDAEGGGTRLRFTETGFTDQGLNAVEVRAAYDDHASAWDHFLPRLLGHAPTAALR